jgi:Pyridoxamine 5'-phosphate oxidase
MSEAEVVVFLARERTVACATVGPRGWPHLMPLWYVLRNAPAGEPGPRVWAWTYGVSQKVRNLERDPRATLQVEAGEAYPELRGVMFECDVVIHRDLDVVASLGAAILLRNSVPRGVEPPTELPPEARDAVEAQAAKRVGLEFVERRRASWDHRKLGGVY